MPDRLSATLPFFGIVRPGAVSRMQGRSGAAPQLGQVTLRHTGGRCRILRGVLPVFFDIALLHHRRPKLTSRFQRYRWNECTA